MWTEKWSTVILVIVPDIHLVALVAIIKDKSHLGTARLLRHLVVELGPHGCMLTFDQIPEGLKG